MGGRWVAYLVLGVSFFEQLAWIPLLVYLAARAGAPEVVVMAASAYSLANAAGNVLAGRIADRWGRRAVAAAGLLATAVTGAGHLAAGAPGALVAVRFAHGLAASAVTPATFALVGDSTAPARRGGAMAQTGVAIALASMAAPPLMGVLADRAGLNAAVLVLAAILVLTAALAAVRLPAGAAALARPAPAGGSGGAGGASPGAASGHPTAMLLSLAVTAGVCLMFGQNVLFSSGTVQARALSLSPGQLGWVFAAFAVGALGVFASPLGRAADRWGRRGPLAVGLALVAAAQGALATVPGPAAMAAVLWVYGVGFGLAFPAITALVSDAAATGRRGLAYGWLGAGFSAGAVLGPQAVRLLSPTVPAFAVPATVTAAGLLAVLAFWPRQKPRTPAC